MGWRTTGSCLVLLVWGSLGPYAAPAAASEIFYCADGRSLRIDSGNRDKHADDPCVKEWFEKSTPKRQAASGPAVQEAPALRNVIMESVMVQRYNRNSRIVVDPSR